MGFFAALYTSPVLLILAAIALFIAAATILDPRMTLLIRLARLIDRLNEIVGKSVSWLILVSILVSAGNAIIRKAFDMSSNAWLELQWYLYGGAFLLAAAYTLKQNEHIRVDIVYGLFSRRVQHWIDLFGHIFFLMPFAVLMSVYLVPYAGRSLASGEMSTNAGGLIIWPAKALLLAGFFLLALQGVSEIIKKIAVMRGRMDDPHPFISAHEQAQLDAESLADEVRQ